jgi:hypothetical protein
MIVFSCHIVYFFKFSFTADCYAWLKWDLYNVDRNVTPWLVAAWYPPLDSTFKANTEKQKVWEWRWKTCCHGSFAAFKWLFIYILSECTYWNTSVSFLLPVCKTSSILADHKYIEFIHVVGHNLKRKWPTHL